MNNMKKKIEYYFCAIMSIICFSITGSLPCVAAENSAGTEESTKVSDTLESVDIRLEEMADKVDLEILVPGTIRRLLQHKADGVDIWEFNRIFL